MAKFKAIFNFQATEGNRKLIEQALERAYVENKDYLGTLANEIVLTFNAYEMPVIALTLDATQERSATTHKERIQHILEQTGLFGYSAL